MNERRWLLLGVVIPVLGVAALIARAEVRLRTGETFRVAITGYDPRDILHGHYLQYRYDWQWQGEHTCGLSESPDAPVPDASCCVCLTRQSSPAAPLARQVTCDAVASCDAWLAGSEVVPPRRYFIPEENASRLEEAFRLHGGQLELRVRPNGEAAIGELYFAGKPWREAVP